MMARHVCCVALPLVLSPSAVETELSVLEGRLWAPWTDYSYVESTSSSSWLGAANRSCYYSLMGSRYGARVPVVSVSTDSSSKGISSVNCVAYEGRWKGRRVLTTKTLAYGLDRGVQHVPMPVMRRLTGRPELRWIWSRYTVVVRRLCFRKEFVEFCELRFANSTAIFIESAGRSEGAELLLK